MRYIYLLLIVLLVFSSCEQYVTKQYQGQVIAKGIEPAIAPLWNKAGSPTEYFIILVDQESNKALRVNTTTATWYSVEKGDTVSFHLNEYDLRVAGNGSEHLK